MGESGVCAHGGRMIYVGKADRALKQRRAALHAPISSNLMPKIWPFEMRSVCGMAVGWCTIAKERVGVDYVHM